MTLATAYHQLGGCCHHGCFHIYQLCGHRVRACARARATTTAVRSFRNNHLNLNLNMCVLCVCTRLLINRAMHFILNYGRHSGSFATTKLEYLCMYLCTQMVVRVHVRVLIASAAFFVAACVDFSAEIEIAIPTLDVFFSLVFKIFMLACVLLFQFEIQNHRRAYAQNEYNNKYLRTLFLLLQHIHTHTL